MNIGKRSVFAVVLGASEYPNFLSLQSSGGEAFKASAIRFMNCLSQLFGENWLSNSRQFLNLFDSSGNQDQQIQEMSRFLKNANADNHHLIIYYVGHGGFIDHDEYFLALRNTREHYERTSSLVIKALADVVELDFPKGNVYLVLDCCFAGAAVQSFQSGMLSRNLSGANERTFPRAGTAILCASSRDQVALSQGSGYLTQFSECFTDVLEEGIEDEGAYLSLRQISEEVRSQARKFGYRRIDPDLHSPRQKGTDAADHQFIPNLAYKTTSNSRAIYLGTKSARLSREDTQKVSTPVAKKLTVLVSGGVATIVLFLFFSFFARVPQLVGLPKEEVVSILESKGFEASLREVRVNRAEIHQVVKLTPLPGSWTRRGAKVYVEYNGFYVRVPESIGVQKEEVVANIESLGLRVSTREIESAVAEHNEVVEVRPAPGQLVRKGAEVEVSVSGFFVQVPELIGAQMDEAVAHLESLGLRVSTREIESAVAGRNDVVEVRPAPGQLVRKGTEVEVSVSGFFVQIPELIGTRRDEVVSTLKELGLDVRVYEVVSQPTRMGEVIDLTPEPGAWTRIGSMVKISVATKIPLAVPDVVHLPKESAVSKLQGFGLEVVVNSEKSDRVKFGHIIRQEPQHGDPIFSGETVKLYVVTGLKDDTTKELQSELNRLQYRVEIDGNLSGSARSELLGIQRDNGLSGEELDVVSLLAHLRELERIPDFFPRFLQHYPSVKSTLEWKGFVVEENISEDKSEYRCVQKVEKLVVQSISPKVGTLVKKGSVVKVDVYATWDVTPIPNCQ